MVPSIEQVIDQVGDVLHANLAISMSPPPRVGHPVMRGKLKVAVARQAAKEARVDSVVPYEYPESATPRVCVLWDRPVAKSARHRVALRSWMLRAGVEPGEVGHIWAYPLVSNVPPLPAQIAEYRDLTLRALELCGCEYVMLVGGMSVGMWRGDVQMQQVTGKWGVWNCGDVGFMVWPTLNPVQAVADPGMIGEIRDCVVRMCVAVNEHAELDEVLGEGCRSKGCKNSSWVFDGEGLGWCKLHCDDALKKRSGFVMKVARDGNLKDQGTML